MEVSKHLKYFIFSSENLKELAYNETRLCDNSSSYCHLISDKPLPIVSDMLTWVYHFWESSHPSDILTAQGTSFHINDGPIYLTNVTQNLSGPHQSQEGPETAESVWRSWLNEWHQYLVRLSPPFSHTWVHRWSSILFRAPRASLFSCWSVLIQQVQVICS